MEEPPQYLREYYERQRLGDEAARRIVRAGRAEAARRRRWLLALGVAAAIGVLIASGALLRSREGARAMKPAIASGDVMAAVRDYFTWPVWPLSHHAKEPRALLAWLKSKDAPAELELPAELANAEGLGCRVIEVSGRRVSLLCFHEEGLPRREGAPPAGASRGEASLVHLVIVPRGVFADAPAAGDAVRLVSDGRWRFAVWSRGGHAFVAATENDAIDLRRIAAAM